MTSLALEARNLYRFYRAGDEETLALKGVSFDIHSGEVVAITGPSGSGKSTLLACLAGLDEPDGGAAWVCGERMSHRTEAERAELRARHVGLLFQSTNLIDHLTVAGNVEFAQRLVGNKNSPAAIIESVELGGRASAYPSELSGGESSRAGLAVALANDPEIILADEPTGELDDGSATRLLDLLLSHADHGAAVLLVTHSPDVVRRAHRVIALNDGQVVAP